MQDKNNLDNYNLMTRKEFEKYLLDSNICSDRIDDYWRLYEKINEPGTPLTYKQRSNFLLSELRKMNDR